MFGPLSFPSATTSSFSLKDSKENLKKFECILCDEQFIYQRQESIFLEHLLSKHNVVIRDVNKVACFDE